MIFLKWNICNICFTIVSLKACFVKELIWEVSNFPKTNIAVGLNPWNLSETLSTFFIISSRTWIYLRPTNTKKHMYCFSKPYKSRFKSMLCEKVNIGKGISWSNPKFNAKQFWLLTMSIPICHLVIWAYKSLSATLKWKILSLLLMRSQNDRITHRWFYISIQTISQEVLGSVASQV